MGHNNFFQFKQFRVVQEKSAMKVGTDGVLLGAWANLNGSARVLDIGTGTGLLALMAAQRSEAIIDTVELEPDAASEALLNFQDSPWQARICLSVGAFQKFNTMTRYDHIISNPPFFENSQKSHDSKRTQARHADSLSLKELLEKSVTMLAENGRVSLILPADKEDRLHFLVDTMNLYITRFSRVASDKTKKPHRILTELSLFSTQLDEHDLFIRDSESGNYSDQYREMTNEFYLAF